MPDQIKQQQEQQQQQEEQELAEGGITGDWSVLTTKVATWPAVKSSELQFALAKTDFSFQIPHPGSK